MADLSPAAAGFDGLKGVRLPNRWYGSNCRIKFKRGKSRPSDYPNQDFKEQLIWFCPDDQSARLLWCNAENRWFELSFVPIDQP